MNIVDWFDPSNIEHLKAYKHLQDTGVWPEGFLLEDIEMLPLWSLLLSGKIVDVYLKEKLENES